MRIGVIATLFRLFGRGFYKYLKVRGLIAHAEGGQCFHVCRLVRVHCGETKLDHSIGLFDKNSEPPKDKTKTFIGKGQTFVFKFIIVKIIFQITDE